MSLAAIQPGFPDPGEYPAFVAGYVSLTMDVSHPVAALQEQGTDFTAWCDRLDPALRLHRYESGKWSIQQVLGHCIDTERTFAYRALRIGRGDESLNPPFEQDDWVAAANHDDAPWPELVDEFRHVRASTVLLFSRLPAEAWVQAGAVSSGTISVRALAHAILGHLEHHRAILRERYL